MHDHKISIIIPVLNEANTIGNLLDYLIQKSNKDNISEIIVVDGGSNDASKDIVMHKAKLSSSIKFVQSQKGRAIQMNCGAEKATGGILYFLHADSYPPKSFCEHIINEIVKGNNAGCFKMKFDSKHPWLKLSGWFTQFSWRSCRGGDQSQFITKSLFDELNGFDERFIVYEDNDLINKLYTKNEFVVIQHNIKTSARRYETNGIFKLQYHFLAIHLKKYFGASAEDIHQYYLRNIA